MIANSVCQCQSKPPAHVDQPSWAAEITSRRHTLIARFVRRIPEMSSLSFALLLPKCPLCIAAWATAAGIGATGRYILTQAGSPQLRPFLLSVLALPLLLQILLGARVLLLQRGCLLLNALVLPVPIPIRLLPSTQSTRVRVAIEERKHARQYEQPHVGFATVVALSASPKNTERRLWQHKSQIPGILPLLGTFSCGVSHGLHLRRANDRAGFNGIWSCACTCRAKTRGLLLPLCATSYIWAPHAIDCCQTGRASRRIRPDSWAQRPCSI